MGRKLMIRQPILRHYCNASLWIEILPLLVILGWIDGGGGIALVRAFPTMVWTRKQKYSRTFLETRMEIRYTTGLSHLLATNPAAAAEKTSRRRIRLLLYVLSSGIDENYKPPTINDPSPVEENNIKQFENDSDQHDNDDEDVSDAEALLACWSYLQRRKRLGNWKEYEHRQAQKAMSTLYFLTDDDNDLCKAKGEEFDIDSEVMPLRNPDENYESNDGLLDSTIAAVDDDLKRYGVFSSIGDTQPSPSYIRRSKAVKKRWADPEYRMRWYQSRWGGNSKTSRHEDKEKSTGVWKRHRKAEILARALPKGFLGSTELASMTPHEIALAIALRTQSHKKRAETLKKTLEDRKRRLKESNMAVLGIHDVVDDAPSHVDISSPIVNRNALFSKTTGQLEEAQRKRSERAKRLYQTRLQNQQKAEIQKGSHNSPHSTTTPVQRPFYPPKQKTPRDALLRIQYDLDGHRTPAIDDVHLVLQPKRLSNRKEILQRILNESFQLYGKCVPILSLSLVGGDENDETRSTNMIQYEFVTHSSVESLGAFIVSLLRNKELNQSSARESEKSSDR